MLYLCLLQLACVQAANSTNGIKHVYVTLTALWKFLHYSPKRAKSLKMVQQVLDLPELKIAKPSYTRWLAHERCVKAVKASYGAIITALSDIHENTHEPEAFGLCKALIKWHTVAAMYVHARLLIAKLSRTLQTEQLNLSMISSLVNATLCTLDDSLLPSANWVLELLDDCKQLEKATGIIVTLADIITFQEQAIKPFIAHLKENIFSYFSSSNDVISAIRPWYVRFPLMCAGLLSSKKSVIRCLISKSIRHLFTTAKLFHAPEKSNRLLKMREAYMNI